jgi:heme-degrading monooxygenase HmoA
VREQRQDETRYISENAMFVVMYRWKLRPGQEDAFIQAWSRVSDFLLNERGSLGSRLHAGSDGLWYSYAQWPSAEARKDAFAKGPVDPEATERMNAAILERFPEVILDPRADFLQDGAQRLQ